MTRTLALALALLAGITLSCSVGSLVGGSGPAEPTEEGVLFQDDFSDTGSGWDRVTADEGETDYVDGAYRIYVNNTDSDYWANPGRSFGDVSVEVQAAKAGGPDDNDFGIICRYQDTDNFYYGAIASDGYAGIIQVLAGEYDMISGESMESNDDVVQGDASNLIRFDCVGSRLTLYVNGVQAVSVTDTTWSTGDVGLIAGTFDVPGADIRFDNFVVREP